MTIRKRATRATRIAHCFGCGRDVGVWQASFNRGGLGTNPPKLIRHHGQDGRRCPWSGITLDPTAVMDAKETA